MNDTENSTTNKENGDKNPSSNNLFQDIVNDFSPTNSPTSLLEYEEIAETVRNCANNLNDDPEDINTIVLEDDASEDTAAVVLEQSSKFTENDSDSDVELIELLDKPNNHTETLKESGSKTPEIDDLILSLPRSIESPDENVKGVVFKTYNINDELPFKLNNFSLKLKMLTENELSEYNQSSTDYTPFSSRQKKQVRFSFPIEEVRVLSDDEDSPIALLMKSTEHRRRSADMETRSTPTNRQLHFSDEDSSDNDSDVEFTITNKNKRNARSQSDDDESSKKVEKSRRSPRSQTKLKIDDDTPSKHRMSPRISSSRSINVKDSSDEDDNVETPSKGRKSPRTKTKQNSDKSEDDETPLKVLRKRKRTSVVCLSDDSEDDMPLKTKRSSRTLRTNNRSKSFDENDSDETPLKSTKKGPRTQSKSNAEESDDDETPLKNLMKHKKSLDCETPSSTQSTPRSAKQLKYDDSPNSKEVSIVIDSESESDSATTKKDLTEKTLSEIKDYQFYPQKLYNLVQIIARATKAEKENMKNLYEKGFHWTLEEFHQYLDALKKYGTKLKKFKKLIPTRTTDEIEEYNSVFWKRYIEIKSEKERVCKVVSNVIYHEFEEMLIKIYENSEEVYDIIYQLRGYCELKFSIEFDFNLLECCNEMKDSSMTFEDVRQKLMEVNSIKTFVQKCNYKEIIDRFVELMEATEKNDRMLNSIFDPKTILESNIEISDHDDFMQSYRNPVLSPYHFYPQKLYEIVNKEFGLFLELINGVTSEYKRPMSSQEREMVMSLYKKGFPSWSMEDVESFIKGIEIFGFQGIEDVAEMVSSKSVNNVQRYAKVFAERYKEIPDEKIRKMVEDTLKRENEGDESSFELVDIGQELELVKSACKGMPSINQIRIPYPDYNKPSKFTMKIDRALVWLMITKKFEDAESFFGSIETELKKQTSKCGNVKDRCVELLELFKNYIKMEMKEDKDAEKLRLKKNQYLKKFEIVDCKFHLFPERLEELVEKQYSFQKFKLDQQNSGNSDESGGEDTTDKDDKENPAPLTVFEYAEMKSLMKSGFLDWSPRDVKMYLTVITKGKNLLDLDYEWIAFNIQDKTPKDVRKYSEVFWERFKELKEGRLKDKAMGIWNKIDSLRRDFLEGVQQLLKEYPEDEDIPNLTESENFPTEVDKFLIEEVKSVDIRSEVANFFRNVLKKLKDDEKFADSKIALTHTDIEERCQELAKAIGKRMKNSKKRARQSDTSRSIEVENSPKKRKMSSPCSSNDENCNENVFKKNPNADPADVNLPEAKSLMVNLKKHQEMEIDELN